MEGVTEPVRAAETTDQLNDLILQHLPPQAVNGNRNGRPALALYGAVPCDAPGCHPLIASRTAVRASDDVIILTSACTRHDEMLALCTGRSAAILPGPCRPLYSRPHGVYQLSSGTDLRALTAALADWDVPPQVFQQPRCTQCGQRILLDVPVNGQDPAGTPSQRPVPRWVTPAGTVRCGKRRLHVPARTTVTDMVITTLTNDDVTRPEEPAHAPETVTLATAQEIRSAVS